MKRYIKAGRLSPYSGKALATYENVTNKMASYIPNEIYVNEQYGQPFYINNSGFLHILQRENGNIEDYIVTRENKLKFDHTYCRLRNKEDWEQLQEIIKNAPRV